jgi:hypothetical protein
VGKFFACDACRVYRHAGEGKTWADWIEEHGGHGKPLNLEFVGAGGRHQVVLAECITIASCPPRGYRNELTPLEQLAFAGPEEHSGA